MFLDDILIYSRNLEEHLQYLSITFKVLIQHKILVKKAKCSFGAARVGYLGHIISTERITTDPKKTEVVQDWCNTQYYP